MNLFNKEHSGEVVTEASATIEEIRKELQTAQNEEQLCSRFSDQLQHLWSPDVICIHYQTKQELRPSAIKGSSHLRFNFVDKKPHYSGFKLSSPSFATVVSTSYDPLVTEILLKTPYQSCSLIPFYISQDEIAVFEVSFFKQAKKWSYETRVFLEKAVRLLEANFSRLFLSRPSDEHRPERQYDSDVASDLSDINFNIISVETSADFIVTKVGGNPEKLLGLTEEQIVGNSKLWATVMHPSDAKKLLLKTQRGSPKDLQDEFRIVHQQTGEVRALLVSASPKFDANHIFLGWHGFALDVTGRYQARQELLQDRIRLEALYKLSQSIQTTPNSSLVALQSLKTLISATQADNALMVLFQRDKVPTEIAAAVGFELSKLESFERSPEFGMSQNWIFNEERVLTLEGQKALEWLSKILPSDSDDWMVAQVRLEFEGMALGCMLLFTHKPKFFSTADLELLDVAAGQISLAVRQAELFIAEKEQAQSLGALYRLSHELSKQLSAQDVIEHAVPIIKEELACKRIWLGVVNEQQTLLTGQSAIGPGLRDGIVDLRIDLTLSHPFLDSAIRTKQSVVVPSGASATCSDLSRMFDRLEVGSFVLVPLVALGQVVGMIAVEPIASNTFFSDQRRQLLDSMASEIATIILARRFESRIADSAKMKMASLLASGVAHNFNNLLQAIMGQASLIELDSLSNEQKSKVAQMIMEAASKGAKLVKQLYSFSSESTFSPDSLSVKTLLLGLQERIEQQLSPAIKFEVDLSDDSLEIKGDESMLRQVILNLVENSKEALADKENGFVKITAIRSRVRSGDVHTDLSPGSYVCLTVEDNGHGMSEEQLARCFEPFFSTKNVDPRTGLSFSGAGLGLSAAYLIVRQHSGAMIVNSHEGVGSTFSVYLPIVTLKSKETDAPELLPDRDLRKMAPVSMK